MVSGPSRRIVVGAAGYGKTTLLRGLCPPARARWWRGGGDPCGFVRQAESDGVRCLVLDDLPQLSVPDLRDLLIAIEDLPEDAEVSLASRWPLPWRHAGRPGRWSELGPAELALAVDEIAALLAEEGGPADPDLADALHASTRGWPALVHFAVESVRLGGPAASAPAAGGLAEYVRTEVLSGLPDAARRLLADLGDRRPVTVGLCEAFGHADAEALLTLLRRTGLLVRGPMVPGLPDDDHVVPVIAQVAAVAGGVPGGDADHDRTAGPHVAQPDRGDTAPGRSGVAAAWYGRHGPPGAAAREHLRAGDHAGAARVLREHGDRVIAAGQAALVTDVFDRLPEPERDRRLTLLRADALRTAGDLEAATRVYEDLGAGRPDLDAGLAWRAGRVAYQRGDAHGALDVFARGGERGDTADTALLAAWRAHAFLLAGDTDSAVATARAAVHRAVRSGDDGALATAYLSVALSLGVAGDTAGSEEHFALALPIAHRTGDVMLLTRIHTNRTFQHLQAARYPAALESAQLCAAYAQAAGSPSLQAIATCNEADALAMLGRYEEAVRRYRAAIGHYQRFGSRRFAGAVLGLAELYRRRGWREQARAAYEQVVQVASGTGNAHVLVPALAGLALVLLGDDVKTAAGHADAAADQAGPEISGPALLAQGWIALSQGAAGRAGDLSTEGARVARAQGDRAGLADALELRAAAEDDPVRAGAALREARAIWTEAGAEVEAARIAVLMSRVPWAGPDERAGGVLGEQRLAAADALADRIGGFTGAAVDRSPVVVRALGRFEVELAGQVVPASSWQSRKARDLLRILVGRRGRPVPRSELSELLWPDGDGQRTGHRLSVLLNIVRGVLDPSRAYPADHHLVADQGSITLNTATTGVDVEDFLEQVARGRRLVEQEALPQARLVLLAADQLYRADAFEDEPYAEWAGPLREEARAAYLAMLRMLAHTCRSAGQPGAAVGYLLRLLERDPYDERAYRSLVRTLVAGGQHGEARRAFDRYAEAMRSIGVRPPDPDLLVPVRRAPAPR
ncbi:BTAD domain-containing putative transcriptional regulator [Catellatospora vulcania]|uniref:BTAD domain-containing putative transcriptional regulator n=1 Tax=Catellatospora vulcania TaxID=1460450 RepID=UPI0012D45CFE|nr:BTAD domain-containing putative transcriptional regulator [Catellatospora vulcania]